MTHIEKTHKDSVVQSSIATPLEVNSNKKSREITDAFTEQPVEKLNVVCYLYDKHNWCLNGDNCNYLHIQKQSENPLASSLNQPSPSQNTQKLHTDSVVQSENIPSPPVKLRQTKDYLNIMRKRGKKTTNLPTKKSDQSDVDGEGTMLLKLFRLVWIDYSPTCHSRANKCSLKS